MNILAFECSTEDIYIFLKTDEIKKTIVHRKCLATEFLIEKIDQLLKEFNLSIKQINVLGVGIGPGSFTGSRVAVVTAKAFASVFNLKLVVFNSFDLLSYNERKENVVRVVEGFSDFVYVSGIDASDSCRTKSELLNMLIKDSVVLSRVKISDEINNTVVDYDIENVVTSKIKNQEFVSIDEIEPIYLRASQAELQLEQKRKKNEN